MYSSAYVWAKILNHMESKLNALTISAGFDDAEVLELNEDNLILYSPSDFRRDVIIKKYTVYIEEALKEIFHSNAKLLVYGDKEREEMRTTKARTARMDFNPQYTFENYVVGPSNRFAHSASIAVSKTPGQVYNPLFIYGPSGLGKTHLLYAIANEIRQSNPEANIVYIRGDEFTNELIAAIQSGKNVEFRNKYRDCDLFLIDDIQFIAGKQSTQEEFFNTFNTLHENHRQIVMTSDRKPSDMATLEERLRTRFEWGLLADIQPPDYETRMAILRSKTRSMGVDLPDDVCDYIATNITDNVRQIEGAVKKLMAYRDLDNMPLTLSNVSRLIQESFVVAAPKKPTAARIIAQVCRFYSIDEEVLRGPLKKKNIAEARQAAMYLIRTMVSMSLPDIGHEFGDRDHTSVLYAVGKVEKAVKAKEEPLCSNLKDIMESIQTMN